MMRNLKFLPAALLIFLRNASAAPPTTPAPEPPKDAAAASSAPAEQAPLEAGADIICEADIFYNWKPAPPQPNTKKIFPETTPTPGGEEVAPSEPPESIRAFFTTAGEEGIVEDEVKNRLNTKIPLMQRQASEYCKTTHQDQTHCVSAKIRTSNDQYNKLDFISRRAMLEAMNQDCIEKMGKCLDTEVSDIKCHVNRPPDVVPKPPEAKAAPGKAPDPKTDKKK